MTLIYACELATNTQPCIHIWIHNINYTCKSRSFPAFQEHLRTSLDLFSLYFNNTRVNTSENKTVPYIKLFYFSLFENRSSIICTKQVRCYWEHKGEKLRVHGMGKGWVRVWTLPTAVFSVQTGETLPAMKNSQTLNYRMLNIWFGSEFCLPTLLF